MLPNQFKNLLIIIKKALHQNEHHFLISIRGKVKTKNLIVVKIKKRQTLWFKKVKKMILLIKKMIKQVKSQIKKWMHLNYQKLIKYLNLKDLIKQRRKILNRKNQIKPLKKYPHKIKFKEQVNKK